MSASHPHFCQLPWTSVHLHPTGLIKACCVSRDAIGDTRKGDTLLTALNSEKSQQLRRDFLAGERPTNCWKCWLKEDQGVTSIRTIRNFQYQAFDASQVTENFDESRVTHLDLSFSRVCNLTCRFCGPYCSSKWQDVARQLPAEADGFWNSYKRDFGNFDYSAEQMMAAVDRFPNLIRIETKGGEPLMSKEWLKLLTRLVEVGRAPHISIEMTSNGTLLPSAFIPVLKRFRVVTLNLSIDGLGDLYRYIRGHDGAEEQIEAAVDFFNLIPGVRINLNFTMCGLNIFGLADFWAWYQRLLQRVAVDVYLGSVIDPAALSPAYLPRAFRDLAISRLPQGDHDFLRKARRLLEFGVATSADEERKRLGLFWRFVKALDEIHGTSLLEVEPMFKLVQLPPPHERADVPLPPK